MDEIQIYDMALTQAQIAQLASVPEPASLVLLAMGVAGLFAGRRLTS